MNGDNILGGAFRGLDNGIKGVLVQSGLMIGTFGAGVIPSKDIQSEIRGIENRGGVNPGRFSPLFRRCGAYGKLDFAFHKRGDTWGRNLVVPDNDFDTYTHEYVDYLQEIMQGFGGMQSRGIWEQATMGNNSYFTPGTNEYQAEQWSNR